MENKEITTVKLLVIVGILITLFLATAIILFVVYYQRTILLKKAKIKLMESEQQLDLFKASVEAEEQQKEKIANNLHDEINPQLAILKQNLSRHRIQAQKNTFNPDNLKLDAEIIDKVIEDIRATCLDLIPSFLFKYGFLNAIEKYINSLKQAEASEVFFENKGKAEAVDVFDKQAQLAIYRMCLEILNNIFKHSYCTHFKMLVDTHDNFFVIEFIHNGKAVTNDEMEKCIEKSTGLGLKSLKARALILNAKIDYISTINKAGVILTIPYTKG